MILTLNIKTISDESILGLKIDDVNSKIFFFKEKYINDLKDLIKERVDIMPEKQKIIYKGRIISGNQKIKSLL